MLAGTVVVLVMLPGVAHDLTSNLRMLGSPSHAISDLVVLVVVHHVVAYTSTVHTTTRSVLVML